MEQIWQELVRWMALLAGGAFVVLFLVKVWSTRRARLRGPGESAQERATRVSCRLALLAIWQFTLPVTLLAVATTDVLLNPRQHWQRPAIVAGSALTAWFFLAVWIGRLRRRHFTADDRASLVRLTELALLAHTEADSIATSFATAAASVSGNKASAQNTIAILMPRLQTSAPELAARLEQLAEQTAVSNADFRHWADDLQRWVIETAVVQNERLSAAWARPFWWSVVPAIALTVAFPLAEALVRKWADAGNVPAQPAAPQQPVIDQP